MASERELEEALRERDGYHDVADEITDLVAQLLDQDFGEHSSANNPWVRCIEALEDALLAKGSTNDASVNSTTAPEGPSLTGND
jgi:hypothetical protein